MSLVGFDMVKTESFSSVLQEVFYPYHFRTWATSPKLYVFFFFLIIKNTIIQQKMLNLLFKIQ